MAGIPLPALDVRPPQAPPNQLDQLGQILGLRNAIQEAPLRQQALQQQVQSGQLGIQQQQMQLQSARAMMGAFSNLDPSDPNYFQKGIKNAEASGQVLPTQIQGVMNAALDFQTKHANLTAAQQKVSQNRADSLYSLGTQYLKQDDPTMAQDWQTMRPQILSLHQNDPNFDPNSVPMQFPGRQWVQANTTLQGMSAAAMRAAAQQQQANTSAANSNAEHGPLSAQQIQQYNQAFAANWTAQHPKMPVPKSLQLGPGATADDFSRMAKLMPKAAAPTMLSMWLSEHPGKTVDDYMAAQNSMKPEFPRVVLVNDAKGNVVGYNLFSGTGGGVKAQYVSASQIAGMPQNLGSAPGVIPPKPTGSVLTQSQRAEMIQPQVQALDSQIDAMASQLGPLAGRWSDVMAGKVGANNPGIAKLQMQLKLFSTALMLAHGLRGEAYEKSLNQYLNASQSPANLKARIEGADAYLQDYAGASGHGPGAGQPNPGSANPQPAPGADPFAQFGGVAH